ncbi:alkaline phosphatase D family protein [Streptomyces sp. NPDC015184]|uniref:alkaline phosphatase D family protein n=1 Tax=Streptomyces sp. NPDC015184 TaxID=3364946 RepID=UPI003700F8DE
MAQGRPHPFRRRVEPHRQLGHRRTLAPVHRPGRPAASVNSDAWDGYQADQTEVLAHLRDLGRRNTVFLSGDVRFS